MGQWGDTKKVIGEARDVWLQCVTNGGFSCPGAKVLMLAWRGRVIPFDIRSTTIEGECAPGDYVFYVVKRLSYFGDSPSLHGDTHVEPYIFADDDESSEAKILAVEAFLAFGKINNGSKFPDGRY